MQHPTVGSAMPAGRQPGRSTGNSAAMRSAQVAPVERVSEPRRGSTPGGPRATRCHADGQATTCRPDGHSPDRRLGPKVALRVGGVLGHDIQAGGRAARRGAARLQEDLGAARLNVADLQGRCSQGAASPWRSWFEQQQGGCPGASIALPVGGAHLERVGGHVQQQGLIQAGRLCRGARQAGDAVVPGGKEEIHLLAAGMHSVLVKQRGREDAA